MVLADTSVWIEYFRGSEEQASRTLRALLQEGEVALVGVVLAELIQGCRTPEDKEAILSSLSGLPFLDTSFSTWKRTGELSASLRGKGSILPLSDLIIATLALEHGHQILTLDPHFEQISGIELSPLQ